MPNEPDTVIGVAPSPEPYYYVPIRRTDRVHLGPDPWAILLLANGIMTLAVGIL